MLAVLDDELIRKCTVRIFVSGKQNGFGFFVAPHMLLTCDHVLGDQDASNIEIHWSDQRTPLPAQVLHRDEKADLALLAIEMNDFLYPYLRLGEDVNSFELLHVYGHTSLTVKGFVGSAEKIVLEAGGDDLDHSDSGTPLCHPRTGRVCGIVSGGNKKKGLVGAVHVKNALKSFPELVSWQENSIRVFIVHAQADEALLDELVESLRKSDLTNLKVFWKEDTWENWEDGAVWNRYPPSFETAQIVLLLVSLNHGDSNAYYADYVTRIWERYSKRETLACQVLPRNAVPVDDWPGQVIQLEEIIRRTHR